MTAKPPTPPMLGKHGKALWADVTSIYALRVDERRVLEQACRIADLIERMDTEIRDAPLMNAGRYKGMAALHPLVAEIRQHRRLLALLMKQLRLPDVDAPAEDSTSSSGARPRSVQARNAALTRWTKAHGTRGNAS